MKQPRKPKLITYITEHNHTLYISSYQITKKDILKDECGDSCSIIPFTADETQAKHELIQYYQGTHKVEYILI